MARHHEGEGIMSVLKFGVYGGLLLTLAGITGGLVANASPAQQADYHSADIHLRRLDILDDSKPGAHVWAVSGQDWHVYGSLYSRHLRDLLSHQRPGARVWLDTSPAALTFRGQPLPDASEVKAFTAFCTAHGLRFSFSPVS